ncbi:hypothetical protein HBA94_17520, partial [Ochrobactrum sp. GRS2]|nr:hypothetical protein [Ochrobactrum sp. GRS2]
DTVAAEIEPITVETEWGAEARGPDLDRGTDIAEASAPEKAVATVSAESNGQLMRPQTLVEARKAQGASAKIDHSAYVGVTDIAVLKD